MTTIRLYEYVYVESGYDMTTSDCDMSHAKFKVNDMFVFLHPLFEVV